jgi:hypothetical protein
MHQKEIDKQRRCSHLLPPPGGEIVRAMLDEIERLQKKDEPTDRPTTVDSPVVRIGKSLWNHLQRTGVRLWETTVVMANAGSRSHDQEPS